MKTSVTLMICAFLVSGCASSPDSASSTPKATRSTNVATANSDDIMFSEMMVPHHEQAVLMAKLALTNTKETAVLALAKQILAAQKPEIDLMKSWLKMWGIPDGQHAMLMEGMLTDAELSALSAARGATFDQLFLNGMIKHHQGAISMAEAVLANGHNLEVRQLATNIIGTQKAEISNMERLLKR